MPTPSKFWDKAARKYAASPIKDMAAYTYTMERVRSYLTPTTRALEIGSGTGSTALLLAPELADITATDISPEMLRIAAENANAEDAQNVTFKVASAGEATAMASGYDVVMGFNLFHLTDNADQLFEDLHAHMTPGAVFISKTPCLADPSIGLKRFAFAALIAVMRAVGYAPFVRRFRFAELEQAIERAGFEIIETGTFPAMSRFIVARR